MSVFSGPNINSNGLVFAYDMNNTDKSWKGAPTTNLLSTNDYTIGTYNGGVYTFDGLQTSGTYAGWYKLTLTTTSTINVLFCNIGPLVTTTGAVQYTASIEYVTPFRNDIDMYWTGNEGAGNAVRIGTTNRYSLTFTKGTTGGQAFYPILSGGAANQTITGGVVYFRNIQVEQSPIVTPWVDGTRSNTQALLDQTGKTTITANNVTYSANNNFSFNGGTQAMTISNTIGPISNNFTIAAWINSTNIAATQNILSMNGPYFMRISNSKVRFNVLAGGVWLFQDGTTTLSSNTWYYFTMVYNFDASLWIGYINGVQEFSVAKTGTVFNATFYGYVGYTPEGGEQSNFFGQIAAVQYYNRALTPTEVSQNFNALRSRYGI